MASVRGILWKSLKQKTSKIIYSVMRLTEDDTLSLKAKHVRICKLAIYKGGNESSTLLDFLAFRINRVDKSEYSFCKCLLLVHKLLLDQELIKLSICELLESHSINFINNLAYNSHSSTSTQTRENISIEFLHKYSEYIDYIISKSIDTEFYFDCIKLICNIPIPDGRIDIIETENDLKNSKKKIIPLLFSCYVELVKDLFDKFSLLSKILLENNNFDTNRYNEIVIILRNWTIKLEQNIPHFKGKLPVLNIPQEQVISTATVTATATAPNQNENQIENLIENDKVEEKNLLIY